MNTEILYNYKTKYSEGFTNEEMLDLLTNFPTIKLEDFNKQLGVRTCAFIDEQTITYRHDIELAIRCCLENRDINSLEFD